ncbi:hypothetical protein DL96DRAFT_1592860 [Flagelloscypha sp. PMI_526]|nr:hypothetical protein DL96DRAFT_1592860 [Flagelloscypha sp. PMI_526]
MTSNCHWDWCTRRFDTREELVEHVVHDHIRKEPPIDVQLWLRSEGLGQSMTQEFSSVSSVPSNMPSQVDDQTHFHNLAPLNDSPSASPAPASPPLQALVIAQGEKSRLSQLARSEAPWNHSASSSSDGHEVETHLLENIDDDEDDGWHASPTASYMISTQESTPRPPKPLPEDAYSNRYASDLDSSPSSQIYRYPRQTTSSSRRASLAPAKLSSSPVKRQGGLAHHPQGVALTLSQESSSSSSHSTVQTQLSWSQLPSALPNQTDPLQTQALYQSQVLPSQAIAS